MLMAAQHGMVLEYITTRQRAKSLTFKYLAQSVMLAARRDSTSIPAHQNDLLSQSH